MNPNEISAYRTFLQTGKIEDYLRYTNIRQAAVSSQNTAFTGEDSAYHDGRNRAAGAVG